MYNWTRNSQYTLSGIFSIGKQTQKINDRMWFFNVGLSGTNSVVKKRQFKTLETILKDNQHTEVKKHTDEAGRIYSISLTVLLLIASPIKYPAFVCLV